MRTPILGSALFLVACGAGAGPNAGGPNADGPPEAVVADEPLDCRAADTCQGAVTFRTWNVEQFPLDEASFDEVAEIIRAMPADLIGLQEIEQAERFWDLAGALPDYEGVTAQRGYYTGVALLYRPETLDLLTARSLFTEDSYAFPRPVLDATFRVVESGVRLHVIVVHLKARVDAESAARRRAAIEKLDAWAEESGLEHQPMIMMGDFNDELTDPEQYNVFGPLLYDPDFAFLTLPLERSGGYSYISFEAMIDHLIVTQATLDVMQEDRTEILRLDGSWDGYVQNVSDHRPVETVLRVRAAR